MIKGEFLKMKVCEKSDAPLQGCIAAALVALVLQRKGHLRVWRLVMTVPLVSGPLVAYRATE